MGVAQKWHFSTSGGAANLRGSSGDLSEHHGSGITLLGITSPNCHFYAQIDYNVIELTKMLYCLNLNINNKYILASDTKKKTFQNLFFEITYT